MCSDAHFFSTYDVCAHVECRLYNVTSVCVRAATIYNSCPCECVCIMLMCVDVCRSMCTVCVW